MTDIAIYINGRTGSTWFTDYLFSTMNVNGIGVDCLWEYWAENRTYQLAGGHIEPRSIHPWDWTAENMDQDSLFAEKVRMLGAVPGHRLLRFTEHNGYVDKPFDHMLTNGTKWITMVRMDRFDQMISHTMCWVTDRWHVWEQKDLEEYRSWYSTNPITIPVEMCENWLQSYLRFNQRRRRLQQAGLIIGQVTYEKMHDDAMMVAKDLMTSFGVESPIIINPDDLKGSTMKLGTVRDKSNWISNYDELLTWYRSSEWPALVG